ncbi:uncharacterized protein C1orf21 homolog isoform X1 [Oryzias melastigma]|uniref:uncharacterized protein C1orf21 homolog isoform X1 n=2 Tax=Oryzias melastigma TaxID=30732 RepID=UPI000CF7BAFD|nr:uncharacterized protein C1orf21 homolog isoform X1 [Oryzias melastigma]
MVQGRPERPHCCGAAGTAARPSGLPPHSGACVTQPGLERPLCWKKIIIQIIKRPVCSGLKRRAAEEVEMGCTSAKQVSAVSNGEEGKNKAYSNGDVLSDEYKMKGAEEVKYTAEEEAVEDGHGGTEKSALLGKRQHTDESGSNGKVLSIHSSESQQEFFRMLDEKIEKGRDYCSEGEEEDVT